MLKEKESKIYENIDTAISKFNKYGFPYQMKNYLTGHFLVWSLNGKYYQYMASDGTILGHSENGINNFIQILRGEI